MTRTSLTIVLTALACIAPSVYAAKGNSQAGIAVRYSQEMLDNPADAARVYGKLKQAARQVCGIYGGGVRTLQERAVASRCVEQTLADVVRKIDRPLLTQLYTSRIGKDG